MKKKPFDATFDPMMQPGYQTRNKSLDSLSKGERFTNKVIDENADNASIVADKRNLKETFRSFQDIKLTPSLILRRRVR